MKFRIVFFLTFIFSFDLVANNYWNLEPSIQDVITERKIIKELEFYLKDGNKIFGLPDDFILHKNKDKQILKLEVYPNFFGNRSLFKDIQITLNNPKFYIQVFNFTFSKADELNGFEWKGTFQIKTDAININYNYDNGQSEYVYNKNCSLVRLGEVYENTMVDSIRFWSLGKTIKDPCEVFLTKNKWIDQYNEYTLYSVMIANYKGVIGSLTVINIIIEKCEADPNLDVCKLINF